MSDNWEKLWLSHEEFKEVPEVNIYPNITVLNRKLYTFGDGEETYIKFSRMSTGIKSFDELAYLDTNSCMHRVDTSKYIVVLRFPEVQKLTVLGELNERYIVKNKLDSYNVDIRVPPEDWQVVPLAEVWDYNSLDVESLIECANNRIKKNFDSFITHIREGVVRNP